MTKAAVFKKPVIVTKGYCIGEQVEKYKMGITVTENCFAEILAAFKHLIDDDNRRTTIGQAKFDQYHAFHNSNMLDKKLCTLLEL